MSQPAATDGSPIGGLTRVVAAAMAMGTLGPVAAIAYAEGLQPATLSALRATIGAAILGGLLLARVLPSASIAALPRRQRRLLAVAVAVNGLMNLSLFFAFGAMAVGLVMALYYCYPTLVALMSAALGRERLSPVRILALAFAASGVALVLAGQLGPDAHATASGVALAVAAATCQAVYLVAIRGGFDDVPTGQATSLVLAGGLVISGTAALLVEGTSQLGEWGTSPVAWLAIACAGTFGALPKVWVISGVRRIGSTRAAVAMLVEPIVAVTVAALALAQRLSTIELAGVGAILLAVVLAQLPARTGRSPEPERALSVSGGRRGQAGRGPGSRPGGRGTT
jgi:drug/metabolite transporter (DMT)-like permease